MFGDLKTPDEEGFNLELNQETIKNMSSENLEIIVETIFRKAQNEKEYCTFYGNLCENIIKLELKLQG
jgi:hypothetical protein